jgi:hypothetical protein
MTLVLSGQEISVRTTGQTTSVANNCTARIMYYLNLCASVLTFPIPDRLIHHRYWDTLSDAEIVRLYELADTFSPDLMMRIGAFVSVTELPGDSSNEFLEITDTRFAALADSEVVIGGAQVRIVQIMAFERRWRRRNYDEPIVQLRREKESAEARLRAPRSPPVPPPRYYAPAPVPTSPPVPALRDDAATRAHTSPRPYDTPRGYSPERSAQPSL